MKTVLALPIMISLASHTSITGRANLDASDVCEGIVILSSPSSFGLRCTSPCMEGDPPASNCEQVSITHPVWGQGVVCKCESSDYQYCCQLALFSGPGGDFPGAVGDCGPGGLFEPDCDDGDECTAFVTSGPPSNPYPVIFEHMCEDSPVE